MDKPGFDRIIRARSLGIPFAGATGPYNAITDVPGVAVGHVTLIEGEAPLEPGKGPVRTGVTAILPRGRRYDPVFAAWYALNGNGEMTGTAWVEESGFLETPILLTNTHSVGIARDACLAWIYQHGYFPPAIRSSFWALPVVTETYDGRLNDANGFHIRREHVFAALDSASEGPVQEGNVGGGTGMILYQFKGGIGTASREVEIDHTCYTVGALIQGNYGTREQLLIAGAPVGRMIPENKPAFHTPAPSPGSGSVVVILATDAPLLPHQLKRLVKRAPLGIGRLGGIGGNKSGDLFLAFSTDNQQAFRTYGKSSVELLANDEINPLFEAVIQATEEAIVNALVAAQTMTGIHGNTAYAIPHDELIEALRQYRVI